MYLLTVDSTQIQSYIFTSNRLRENYGASYLVAASTEEWTLQAVREVTQHSNVSPDGRLDPAGRIEEQTARLEAEVVYAGGGNFVVLFREEGHARAFTRRLSQRVLTDAPGLQLVIAQQPFDWGQPLAEKVKDAFRQLEEKKRSRRLSAPLLGLGVTVMCQSTGLPAVGVTPPIGDDQGYPASAEIFAKTAAGAKADERLHQYLKLPDGYGYPRDFDDLGRSWGDQSHIAVVHADGNRMGQRIMAIRNLYLTASNNRDYITALRGFSNAVEDAAQDALIRTLAQLVEQLQQAGGRHLEHKNAAGKTLAKIELKEAGGGTHFLPFRPLVFGGDDVTFVCDGRLGLSMADLYLRYFEEETAKRPECKGQLTACAGIAIVKTHYPFARAYDLAHKLCQSAKDYRWQQDLEGSCLDWHFALSGLSGDIKEIRRREYMAKEGSLTLRPVTLGQNPKEPWKAWDVIRKGIAEFQDVLPQETAESQEERWAGRRNKVKALRDALREGSQSVRSFLGKFNQGKPLPEVNASMTDWKSQGWQLGYCGYFDAIEMADWFIPLEKGGLADAVGAAAAGQE
jgi:hypothetical protein